MNTLLHFIECGRGIIIIILGQRRFNKKCIHHSRQMNVQLIEEPCINYEVIHILQRRFGDDSQNVKPGEEEFIEKIDFSLPSTICHLHIQLDCGFLPPGIR